MSDLTEKDWLEGSDRWRDAMADRDWKSEYWAFPPPPDAPTEEELRALDHPDECCSPTNCYGNDHMTQGEAEAIQMQEQTSEYRRMTE